MKSGKGTRNENGNESQCYPNGIEGHMEKLREKLEDVLR